MPDRPLSALVVATASGAPMRSERPKPIHLLCGKPMLSYVLEALGGVNVGNTVVVTGPRGDWVSKRVMEDPPGFPVRFVEQRGNRGTADAALVGLTGFDDFEDEGDLLVVPADIPLIDTEMLATLLFQHRRHDAALTLLSAVVDDPVGKDRVLRDERGNVSGVAADSDLVGDEFSVNEISLGVICVRRGLLAPAARRTAPAFADGRHRLADVAAILAETGHPVVSAVIDSDAASMHPVNNRRQLADAEAELRRRTNERWLDRGVTMVDPQRTYIDSTVQLGIDITLFPGTILQGNTVIGDGCEIGPDTRIDRCVVGRDTVVEKTTALGARIGDQCNVGPFAVIEPGAELADGTVTGPFYVAGSGD